MSDTAPAEDAAPVLWDVIDEHLSEVDFLFEQVTRAAESLVVTPALLEKGLEARLLAHVDGLVVGGGAVRDRRLVPAVAAAADDLGVFTAAALALAATADFGALQPALAHGDEKVRAAAVRACVWTSDARWQAWVASRHTGAPGAAERASLLDLAAGLGVRLTPIVEWLQAGDAVLPAAAGRAAVHTDRAVHRHVVDSLLDGARAATSDGALVAGLTWGSERATALLARRALDRRHPDASSMALYAALGGNAEHERLVGLLSTPSCARGALFALGFSGNPRMLGALLAAVGGADEGLRKLAACAIAMITGMDLDSASRDPAKSPSVAPLPADAEDPEAKAALPPLEDDDLSADLAPSVESALPDPDAAKVRAHCEAALQRLAPARRHLAGAPFSLEALARELLVAPLGQRHTLALSLFVRSQGAAWINTRARMAIQRAQIARALAVVHTLGSQRSPALSS